MKDSEGNQSRKGNKWGGEGWRVSCELYLSLFPMHVVHVVLCYPS